MYCMNCGNKVSSGDVYCQKCGQKINKSSNNESNRINTNGVKIIINTIVYTCDSVESSNKDAFKFSMPEFL